MDSPTPKTYAEILALAKVAQIASCNRALGQNSTAAELCLTLDDYEQDRRTCITVRMGSGKAGQVKIRTLCGYSPTAKRWRDYCAPAGSYDLPDRKGQKALIAWCAERSQELTGWPGSAAWSLYRPVPVSTTSHLMARALTY